MFYLKHGHLQYVHLCLDHLCGDSHGECVGVSPFEGDLNQLHICAHYVFQLQTVSLFCGLFLALHQLPSGGGAFWPGIL